MMCMCQDQMGRYDNDDIDSHYPAQAADEVLPKRASNKVYGQGRRSEVPD